MIMKHSIIAIAALFLLFLTALPGMARAEVVFSPQPRTPVIQETFVPAPYATRAPLTLVYYHRPWACRNRYFRHHHPYFCR
jgi:hypothetical protein